MQILNWPFVLSDGLEYMLLVVILLIETWGKNVILIPPQGIGYQTPTELFVLFLGASEV